MKNKLFTIFLALMFVQSYWSQNSGLILATKYRFMGGALQNLPTIPPLLFNNNPNTPNTNYWEGYKGQAAQSAQNIIVDNNGDIVFFIVDQYIYSKTGRLIDVITSDQVGNENAYVTGIGSEITVIPAPDKCDTYYLVSTKKGTGVVATRSFYSKLVVKYDAFNEILPGSGLQLYGGDACENKTVSLASVIGSTFFAGNNMHDEAPSFAVVDRANTNNKFLFVFNGRRLFRLKVDNNGITYDNYKIDLQDDFQIYAVTIDLFRRFELEAILKADGNYRVAIPINYKLTSGSQYVESIFVVDLDNTGTLITGSDKLVHQQQSNANTGSDYRIKGLELSPDGSKLYVTHRPDVEYPGSLDVIDLSVAVPTNTMIESSNIYEYSQIEASFSNTLLIPHANGLSRITNANGNYALTTNYLAMNYPLSNPYPGQDSYNLRLLQDQIDGSDYSNITTTSYGDDTYNTVLANQTWIPNPVNSTAGNPLINGTGTVAYIKDELRIKAGTTLTIQGLTIRFAPGARVVVEHGYNGLQGGRLILNNSVLSDDDRCGAGEMWLGVEVWGNQTASQGTLNNTTQGRLIMRNNSTIENAFIGTLLSKRNSTTVEIPFFAGDCNYSSIYYLTDEVVNSTFDFARNGGIVQTSNSTYFNNQRGVSFKPYGGTNGANNLSRFSKSHFVWNGPLKGGISIAYQAQLKEVKGINFTGCEFVNATPNLIAMNGYGILSQKSQFYVNPECNVAVQLGQQCPSQTPSTFTNFLCGIRADNANSLSFSCVETTFRNNQYGIYTRGAKLEKITSNIFEIRESDVYQTAGLSMYSSSGYKVEGNKFYEYNNPLVADGTGRSNGIVVNNSGAVPNEIYRNEFHNLKIGGQTECVNATAITTTNYPGSSPFTMAGLKWICNDFQQDIVEHDLTLINGKMDYYQGYGTFNGTISQLNMAKKAARNKFSLTHESMLLEHDIKVGVNSQELQYSYIAATRHTPDSYTPNVVDINEVLWNALPIVSDFNTCPSTLNNGGLTPGMVQSDLNALKLTILEDKALLSNGASETLLTTIENGVNDVTKNTLLTASPYLSDKVLLTYVAKNPPSGHLKQVMIANSPLPTEVKLALSLINLPNGIANQIAAKQVGVSKRTALNEEINYLQGQYDKLYNDYIRTALLDPSEEANFDNLISILKEAGDVERLKMLLSTHITNKDDEKIQETKEALSLLEPEIEFVELAFIQEEISKKPSTSEALEIDPSLTTQLENLKNNSSNEHINRKIDVLLELNSTLSDVPEFLKDNTNRSATAPVSVEKPLDIDLSKEFTLNMYPNPSTGIVTIDYPEQEDGDMKIEIIDLSGKTVHTILFTTTNGQQIDLRALNKGMYLVKISFDDVVVGTQKLKLQ